MASVLGSIILSKELFERLLFFAVSSYLTDFLKSADIISEEQTTRMDRMEWRMEWRVVNVDEW